MEETADVIVVGAGNAALCAALAASEAGASVTVLECAPRTSRGGNSAFTAGAMRVVYNGVEDLLELVPDLSESEIQSTDFGSYTAEQFFDDMARVTEYRADPDLLEVMVYESLDALKWMRSQGVRFVPLFGRQGFNIDGVFTFWGGLTVEVIGGGPGLVDALSNACEERGIPILYETRAQQLTLDDHGAISGVMVTNNGTTRQLLGRSVVLACGGFQANAEWRARYLGYGWDLAKVRGTQFNTGDGIRMAIDIGASTAGHWSGCHAVQWDRNAPEFGDLAVGDGFQKHSYPFGIVVNQLGQRFIDEGADFRNYTYAKYGRDVLNQPGQVAWQVFDAKVAHLMRDEYSIPQVTKVTADTIEELAARMDGMNADAFIDSVREFNAAVDTNVAFDPNVKDGRRTVGLTIPKSNWANPLDTPPFSAYMVTCGITFTFGGLRITPKAEVVSTSEKPIPGLYACGELVGGLFYFNYPGGSGLTAGSVFGRIAGTEAASAARARVQDRSPMPEALT